MVIMKVALLSPISLSSSSNFMVSSKSYKFPSCFSSLFLFIIIIFLIKRLFHFFHVVRMVGKLFAARTLGIYYCIHGAVSMIAGILL